jgi:NADH:ubiquinone oxidoreductase subunit 3 (subunit A)
MGEYSALLLLTALGGLVAGLLVLFHVRVAPRRPRQQVTRSADGALAALERFQIYAALFVAFGGLALLLAAWAARIDTLGRAGLGVAALVTAPVLVGFAHLVARGGLEENGLERDGLDEHRLEDPGLEEQGLEEDEQ